MDPLNLTCPSCHHQFDMISGLQGREQRDYIKLLAKSKLSADQMGLLFRYLNFFKPLKNSMSYRALSSRTEEILSQINDARVTLNNTVRVAPKAAWFDAIERLVTETPASLSLPQRSHKYLISMVWNDTETIAAKKETKQINEKRFAVRTPDPSDEESPERDERDPKQAMEFFDKVLPNRGKPNGS